MRIGECLALHSRDVDLAGGEIHIRASVSEIAGRGVVRGKTKSGRHRKVPINAAVVERLRRLRVSSPVLPSVFSNEIGGPLRASKLSTRRLHPLLTELGIEKGGFHRFRHSYASLVLRAGIDVATVSKILGHANPSITLSIYTHFVAGREREASEAIAAALAGGGVANATGGSGDAS
jgi:integrase